MSSSKKKDQLKNRRKWRQNIQAAATKMRVKKAKKLQKLDDAITGDSPIGRGLRRLIKRFKTGELRP